MNLQEKLNDLYGGVVTRFHYDIVGHCITLSVDVTTDNNLTTFEILLDEVSLFFFEDSGADLFSNFQWDSIELTSVNYLPHQTMKIITSINVNETIDYNIFIELWSSNLFVKANKLKIDQNLFIL